MSAHAQLQRCRALTPSVSAPVQMAPYGAGSSEAQITLSPMAPATSARTTGFMFLVLSDTVTTVTVWKRDPATGAWGILASFDATLPDPIAPFTWVSVCGILASELWFQSDAASATHTTLGPLILVEETSG